VIFWKKESIEKSSYFKVRNQEEKIKIIWPIPGSNLTQNNKNKKASRIQLADFECREDRITSALPRSGDPQRGRPEQFSNCYVEKLCSMFVG
jgi:hypothetical protein